MGGPGSGRGRKLRASPEIEARNKQIRKCWRNGKDRAYIMARFGINIKVLGDVLAPHLTAKDAPRKVKGKCHRCGKPAKERFRGKLWCDPCFNPDIPAETLESFLDRKGAGVSPIAEAQEVGNGPPRLTMKEIRGLRGGGRTQGPH